MVHPGNQEYLRGDRIQRPRGGQGGGSGGSGASQDGQGEDDFTFRITREEFMNYFFDDLALPRHDPHAAAGRRAGVEVRRAGSSPKATRPACTSCAPCAWAWRAASRWAATPAGTARRRRAPARLVEARGERPPPRSRLLKAEIEGAARAPQARALPRPVRPALPQPRPRAAAHQQGGDVLPDGRLGLHGRVAQGPGQALLHPAVPVPHAALQADRRHLHPPPHAGGRGARRTSSSTPPKAAAPWCPAR
jgi:hypothetical protein